MVTSKVIINIIFHFKTCVMMFNFCRQNSENEVNSLSITNEKKYLEAFEIYCQIKEHITLLSCQSDPIYSNNNVINIGEIRLFL